MPEISEEEKGSNLSQDLIKRSQESTLAKIHNSAAGRSSAAILDVSLFLMSFS